MNRRAFLFATATVAGARSAVSGRRILDAHTHFYDPSRPQGVPWPSKDSTVLYRTTLPPRFRAIAEPLGVFGTVVVEASPWLEDNQWVLDLAEKEPVIKGVVGHLEPATPEFKTHLARFAKNPLFRGIRLGGPLLAKSVDQAPFLDDMRRLAGLDLELDALGGIDMFANLARLGDAVPGLRVVINHLPFNPSRENATMRVLAGRPHVYAKLSGLPRRYDGQLRAAFAWFKPALDEVFRVFGEDRVIYGSNWPVSDLYADYATGLRIVSQYFDAKGAAAAEKYFWKNSLAAYKWKERG